MEVTEIDFLDIEENEEYKKIVEKVAKKCFEVEGLENKNIRITNKTYRNIDKETDVLSFPMFEKDEIEKLNGDFPEALGDIMISIDRVKEQAIEYGHSFERELSYMVVHGFYHLMGYDHMEESDKKVMREKEENVLGLLDIRRD